MPIYESLCVSLERHTSRLGHTHEIRHGLGLHSATTEHLPPIGYSVVTLSTIPPSAAGSCVRRC